MGGAKKKKPLRPPRSVFVGKKCCAQALYIIQTTGSGWWRAGRESTKALILPGALVTGPRPQTRPTRAAARRSPGGKRPPAARRRSRRRRGRRPTRRRRRAPLPPRRWGRWTVFFFWGGWRWGEEEKRGASELREGRTRESVVRVGGKGSGRGREAEEVEKKKSGLVSERGCVLFACNCFPGERGARPSLHPAGIMSLESPRQSRAKCESDKRPATRERAAAWGAPSRRASSCSFLLLSFISSLFSPFSYLPVEFRGRGRRRRNKNRCLGVERAHGVLVSSATDGRNVRE